MMGSLRLLALLGHAGALAFVAPAFGQDVVPPCHLCGAATQVIGNQPKAPLQLEVGANLDFDRLVTTGMGSGSAELAPDGRRAVSGSITGMGARALLGEVVIRGEPGREVRVELPRTIELTGFNGGAIRVESIRSDLPPLPRLDANGRLSFRLGGVVQITGDADGEFRGNARIEVEYF